MPKVYRMMRGASGKPSLGAMPMTLGVRLPGGRYRPDIYPDKDEQVSPSGQGMSVNPSAGDVLRSIPDARKPLRFRAVSADATGVRRARVPGAVGGPEAEGLFIWSMGVGPFVDAPLANMLQLRTDRDDGARPAAHGVVEPDAPMHVNVYVAALEATRDDWRVDEE